MSKPTTAGILEWLRASAADPMAAEPEDGYVFRLAADRLEAAEANADLNRAMEVMERERADKAEAKLREVCELPEKWRKDPIIGKHDLLSDIYCADELQAILNRGDV